MENSKVEVGSMKFGNSSAYFPKMKIVRENKSEFDDMFNKIIFKCIFQHFLHESVIKTSAGDTKRKLYLCS